jgi:hypothetical protein
MKTLQFITGDYFATALPGTQILMSQPVVRFISAPLIVREREDRAGKDADAEKAKRFPVVAS